MIFINDIDVDLDAETIASLFADDTATWRKDGIVKGSQRRIAQEEVDKILTWADKWKMKVNGDKTRCMIFSNSKDDQHWDPGLKAGGVPVKCVQEYKFLGVKAESDLRFREHVKSRVEMGRKRNRVLKCMSGKSWGNTREVQRNIYMQFVRAALEYASPSWNSWISASLLQSLQRVQNDALRAVVGAAATTPTDFLYLEADIEPLKERLEKKDKLVREKYMRLPKEDDRRMMMEEEKGVRLKTRQGWRESTKPNAADKRYTLEELKPPLEPWMTINLQFDTVTLTKPKEQHSKEELKLKTDNKLAQMEADTIIWTDGSTNGRQEKGGAGVFIQNTRNGSTERMSFPAGEICSSFGAEGVALLRALEWLEMHPVGKTIICTDSLSVHAALKKDCWKDAQDWIRKIKLQCRKLQGIVKLLWVPSHCGVEGNEEADRLAELGTKGDQKEIPITQAIGYAKVKKKRWTITHKRAKTIFRDKLKPKLNIEKTWPRRVQSLYSRLRSDHCKELKAYLYRIEVIDDPNCECGEKETIEHVLCHYPKLGEVRRRVMEEPLQLHHLVSEPEKCRQILATRFEGLKFKHDSDEQRDDGAPAGAGAM